MVDKILAILNKTLPIGIALKSISKINPRLQSFIKGSLAAGYGGNEILSYLKNQISSPQEALGRTPRPDEEAIQNINAKSEMPLNLAKGAATAGLALGGGALASALPAAAGALAGGGGEEEKVSETVTEKPMKAKEPTLKEKIVEDVKYMTPSDTFIRKHPELGRFLDSLIKQGASPVEAAAQAKRSKKWSPLVSSIEESMGQPFEELIGRLFQPSGQINQGKIVGQSPQMNDADLLQRAANILRM